MAQQVDEEGFRDWLRAEVARHGTQRRAAEQLGMSAQYINDILHGNRNVPGDATLTRIGWKRIVLFERIAPE